MLQENAHITTGPIKIRVGIPHRSSKLAFHAFNEDMPVMVSASAYWNHKHKRFSVPESSDLEECDVFLDSAGFTAMANWKTKGPQTGMGHVYPWSLQDYLGLVMDLRPQLYAAPDFCCEPEIASDREQVRWRIGATATLLEGTLRQVMLWQDDIMKRDSYSKGSYNVAANMLRPPVPVLQGWTCDDYRRSLEQTLEVWLRYQPLFNRPALIGVGSVCRRDPFDRSHGVLAILRALEPELPTGTKLHLFGVKNTLLGTIKDYGFVHSVDSMAYDFAARVDARESGISNDLQHRSRHMSRWYVKNLQRVTPAHGDQLALI